jgi:UDP-hydrolysing UDP-N-acetyl-D-glucosamine 2-epimerase
VSSGGARQQKVAIVTSTRADFSILLPVARSLAATDGLDVGWIASGTHFLAEFGNTIDEVSASGLPIWDSAEFIGGGDDDDALVRSDGLALTAYGQALRRVDPDLVLILGDRWEIHACATAATLLRLPIAHIHGGDETEGAIDNVLRHSITKLAHLHFAATELSGRRIRQMGEGAERVFVTGSPAIDKLNAIHYLDRAAFAAAYGAPAEPFLLVTYHPLTTDAAATERGLASLFEEIEGRSLPTLFTFSNADSMGRTINRAIADFCATHAFATVARSLGGEGYAHAMRHALVMLGNSSSGVIEAAYFGLPVVNIGDRQRGRERSGNTIDVDESRQAVAAGLDQALSEPFRKRCAKLPNVYGDGKASERIAKAIADFCGGPMPISKPFVLWTSD